MIATSGYYDCSATSPTSSFWYFCDCGSTRGNITCDGACNYITIIDSRIDSKKEKKHKKQTELGSKYRLQFNLFRKYCYISLNELFLRKLFKIRSPPKTVIFSLDSLHVTLYNYHINIDKRDYLND